jgi:glycosyltransferase involved in cell wall biosynthesis
MKVLHLINTLSAGGAELHLLTLCRHLRNLGVEPVVACLRERVEGSRSLRRDFERWGIRVIDLGAAGRYDSRFFARIVRLVSAEQPDILHTHLPRADMAGAFVKFLRPAIIWVSSVHAIYSVDWSARWTLPLIRRLWRRANRVLCISHAVRDWLIFHELPPERAAVIHYGIETEALSGARSDLRQSWQLEGKFVIGSIGRLEARKGHEVLIRALPEVLRHIPNAQLVIAGHDPWGYGSELRRHIRASAVGDRVRLVGFQSDVSDFFAALDVFAFATYSEGFGQVMVEAMAAGKPVVASRVAPLTEIAVQEESALFVEPGRPAAFADALVRLAREPGQRQQMARRARERVQRCFTAPRMAAETVALYRELCDGEAPLRAFA